MTYGEIVVDYRLYKTDPYRIRFTVRWGGVNYPVDCGTPIVNLTTVKILLNIIVSTLNAKFMTFDIKDFILNTPMARSNYMRLKPRDLPEIVVQHYNLVEKITRYVYVYV